MKRQFQKLMECIRDEKLPLSVREHTPNTNLQDFLFLLLLYLLLLNFRRFQDTLLRSAGVGWLRWWRCTACCSRWRQRRACQWRYRITLTLPLSSSSPSLPPSFLPSLFPSLNYPSSLLVPSIISSPTDCTQAPGL